jgi:hypothetical protein
MTIGGYASRARRSSSEGERVQHEAERAIETTEF